MFSLDIRSVTKLQLFLFTVYFSQARVVDNECEGVLVGNIVHEKEKLLDVDNSPYQLAIDYDTNTLFFSFTSSKEGKSFESGYLNLKTKEFHTIDDIDGGFANAVDAMSHTIYLGAGDGVYKFNLDSKKTEYLNISNHNIWQLFYKNNLYYTTYPDELVYIYKDGKIERVPELKDTRAMLIVIDNNNNIYFSNSSGLYVHDHEVKSISTIVEYNIESLTIDTVGKIYFCTDEDIYRLVDSNEVEKLASLKQIFGLAVEKDGSLIVGLYNSIIRIKPTDKQCTVNEI
ncbi:hypothetical protein KGM_202074 [Danaus plexippus plexippus]|uniref:Uncharacterized protein n=1 Tax=Danaus plexippus plexippus TaxID=278856 RepID=A0A212EGN2_DANPL|nr:hypothetical protein KGM_202074 [Danaus plexippus plexippus]